MSTTSKSQGKATYVASRPDEEWLLSIQTKLYRQSWEKTPNFAVKSMESPVHNERCTPGSGTGAS